MTPIRYIGHREKYRDGLYNTGIIWTQGDTQLVPDDKAKLLLRHPDVYVRGKESGAKPAVIESQIKPADSEAALQDARDLIANMDKDALENYARTNYRIELDKRQSPAKLREQVTRLVDQFGLS